MKVGGSILGVLSPRNTLLAEGSLAALPHRRDATPNPISTFRPSHPHRDEEDEWWAYLLSHHRATAFNPISPYQPHHPTATAKTRGLTIGGVRAMDPYWIYKYNMDIFPNDEDEHHEGEEQGLESMEDSSLLKYPFEKAGETWDEVMEEVEKHMVEVFGSDYLRLCIKATPPTDES